MRSFVFALSTLLFFVNPFFSQNIEENISEYLEKARTEWGIPGMAVGIVKDGKIVLNKGYGVLEEGKKGKVNENSLFAIASNTKAFTSTAIAQLVSEGKLEWDDKVRQHLPQLELYDEYVSEHFTIKDLLCHRSGLGTYSGDVIWYKSKLGPEDLLERIAHIPQKYEFRNGYGYSNLMFIVAGLIIEKISGEKWQNYIQNHILTPLEMDRTQTSVTGLSKNVASPHKEIEGIQRPIDWVNWDNMAAAGGIVSSSEDMTKWLLMNLATDDTDSETILDPAQQSYLWTPANNFMVSDASKIRLPGRSFSGIGLGWFVSDYFGNRIISHGGGYDGMYSKVVMVPELELGIVILTNAMEGISTPLTYYIINQFVNKDDRDWSAEYHKRSLKKSRMEKEIEAAQKARVAGTSSSKPLSEFTGSYFTEMYGEIEVKEEEDRLQLHFLNAPELNASLSHWHYDTYQIHWEKTHAWFDFGTVQFTLDNNRKVSGLEFFVPNNDIFFHELHFRKK